MLCIRPVTTDAIYNIKNKCKKPSLFFSVVNWYGQLWDIEIAKLTLIDGENLREMNLVFLLHVAVYRETVGGDVGGVSSLFTQVLWDKNNRGRPRSQTRSNKTKIPKQNIMAAFNLAGLLQRCACYISRSSLRTTMKMWDKYVFIQTMWRTWNYLKCFWVLSKIESNFDKILTQVFDVIPMFILRSMLILLDSWRNKTRNASYVGTNQTVGKVTNGVLQIIKYMHAIRKQNVSCW